MIFITLNNQILKIKGKSIEIGDDHTLIRGSIKLEEAKKFKDPFFKKYTDFNLTNLKPILEYLESDYLENIEKSIDLLDYLKKFKENSQYNSEVIENDIEILTSINEILEYKNTQQKINHLKNELKLAELKKDSNQISAKVDLIEKLRDNLNRNEKRLEYLKEDFYKIKNKRDQIKNRIKSFKDDIKELNQKKKENFDLINKITRKIETENSKGENITQKIMKLRKEAKNYHYQAGDLQKQLRDLRSKLQEVKPQYKSTEDDYKTLKDEINRDKKTIHNLEIEVKDLLDDQNINKNYKDSLENYSIRSPDEIKSQMSLLRDRINNLEQKNQLNNPKEIRFSNLKNQIIKFQEEVKESKILDSTINFDKLKEVINAFTTLELTLEKIETFLNSFLNEINLDVSLSLLTNEDFNYFKIHISFTRSKKEKIPFEQLTTPEKVFFVISLFIAFNLAKGRKVIFFSNLILPDDYNKRGSLYRTIRKILPLFYEMNELKESQLIFLISDLEMKRSIKNIKMINFE